MKGRVSVTYRQQPICIILCMALLHTLPWVTAAPNRGSGFLDSGGKYFLSWSIGGNNEDSIYFEVTAETKGYVGLGVSPNGGMKGADILLAGVNSDGSLYYTDRHGVGNWMPAEDTHQNWHVTFGDETGGRTKLRIHRKLNTCDTDDLEITDSTIRIIWAMGETDEIVHGHQGGKRGTYSVNFFKPGYNAEFDPSRYLNETLTLTMEMPPQLTTYWCNFHRLPELTKQHHIVAFEPLLESLEAMQHTHHFIVHRCTSRHSNISDWLNMPGDFCYVPNNDSFPFFHGCYGNMVFGWAKGGQRMVFPPDVGLPFPETLGKTEYFALEVHMDNPESLSGITFTTGLRIYYTPEVRENDAGLLLVEHVTRAQLTIPPNSKDYIVAGHCSGACTEEFLPDGGITVFNSLLHAHLAARKIKLRHFRGNQELEWLDNESHYDFNFQQNKALEKYRKLERGDHLTIECTYETKEKAVIGGFSTQDEMCQAWLFYYPRVKANSCGSEQNPLSHFKLLGMSVWPDQKGNSIPTFEIREPQHLAGDYLESISYKMNWTAELREKFQKEKRFGQQDAFCYYGGEPKRVGLATYPGNMSAYVPPSECQGVTQQPPVQVKLMEGAATSISSVINGNCFSVFNLIVLVVITNNML